MKQEYTQTKTYCDCCGEEIRIPTVLRNDGSFQYFHIRKEENDLCLRCCALILSNLELEKEKLNSSVENVKKRYFEKPNMSLDISFPTI